MMTGIDPDEAAKFRRQMVERLVDLDYVPVGWADALEAVPRHLFVPDTVWHPVPGGYVPYHRDDDPTSWLTLAYRHDDHIVAQVDNGAPSGMGRYATCTVMDPTDITFLLGLVPITPGMRVCLVGAGLGYLTALLAHKLGADAVSAVEIDPGLATDCRRRLASVGLDGVDVLTADATVELPDGAPFDLILSTVTVRHVPGEWLRRVRTGGTIITGFATTYRHHSIIQLAVHHPGLATGHVVGEIEYDWERGQPIRPTLTTTDIAAAAGGADSTTFDVDRFPNTSDAIFTIGIRVPNCVQVYLSGDDLWFLDPATGSRAHWHRPVGRYRVDQYGPRRLWDEITTAYQWWRTNGQPEPGEWLITATPHTTTAELPTTLAAAAG